MKKNNKEKSKNCCKECRKTRLVRERIMYLDIYVKELLQRMPKNKISKETNNVFGYLCQRIDGMNSEKQD